MSLIVSLSSPFFGSVNSSKERRWISISGGISRGFLSREKLLRVTGAALERAKSATPQRFRGTVVRRGLATVVRRRLRAAGHNGARPLKITHGPCVLQA